MSSAAAATLTKDFNGLPIIFREDGYINMTKAAKHFGKKLPNFWANEETDQYIQALSQMSGIPAIQLKETRRGNGGGTYGHPKLAIRFARWMSVEFEVWCDLMIDNILHGNIQTTVVVPTLEALEVNAVVAPLRARILALEEQVAQEAMPCNYQLSDYRYLIYLHKILI